MVGAIAIAFVLNAVIFHPYQVFGASMSPTLEQGDRLIVSKLAKSWASLWNREYVPARGEIIVFKNPVNPTEQLVKRVIALPGERIVVGDGEITVYNSDNPEGFDPDEAYKEQIDDKTAGNLDIEISEHHIFVSGDNRELGGSLDSRNGLGTVPLENVVGELILRITPFPEAKFF